MSIFKACDIRGRYGVELLDDHAHRLGLALARQLGPVAVVVGGDGRLSTPILKQRLIEGLVRGGCPVVDVGVVTTPALYFARQHLNILPGVMVTASHNAAGDNGFKIALGELPVTPDDITRLAELMQSEPEPADSAEASAGGVQSFDVLPEYTRFASGQATDLRGMRVVVDCANGTPALVATAVWRQTGAQVDYLFDSVDGEFPNHPPDPSVHHNLSALTQRVVDGRADLGVAYDGDGDRTVFVDGRGQPLNSDRAIVLFARRALAHGPAPIVYDQKCSLIVPETIHSLGGQPVMERSGHTFIKTTFLKLEAPYAGEISGHHFFGNLRGDDGLIASLYMAEIVKRSGASLAELADAIRMYPITPEIRLKMDAETARQVIERLTDLLSRDARLSTRDGLRVEFDDAWGIVRQSVTEPAITLRFEGKTRLALQNIVARFEQAAPELAGKIHLPIP